MQASLDLSMTFDEIQRVADDLLTALPNLGEGPASIEGAPNDVVRRHEDADAPRSPASDKPRSPRRGASLGPSDRDPFLPHVPGAASIQWPAQEASVYRDALGKS